MSDYFVSYALRSHWPTTPATASLPVAQTTVSSGIMTHGSFSAPISDGVVGEISVKRDCPGPMQSALGNRETLRTLRLAHNQLEGFIPPDLWAWTSDDGRLRLSYVRLSGDRLRGCVPATWQPPSDFSADLPVCKWNVQRSHRIRGRRDALALLPDGPCHGLACTR